METGWLGWGAPCSPTHIVIWYRTLTNYFTSGGALSITLCPSGCPRSHSNLDAHYDHCTTWLLMAEDTTGLYYFGYLSFPLLISKSSSVTSIPSSLTFRGGLPLAAQRCCLSHQHILHCLDFLQNKVTLRVSRLIQSVHCGMLTPLDLWPLLPLPSMAVLAFLLYLRGAVTLSELLRAVLAACQHLLLGFLPGC